MVGVIPRFEDDDEPGKKEDEDERWKEDDDPEQPHNCGHCFYCLGLSSMDYYGVDLYGDR